MNLSGTETPLAPEATLTTCEPGKTRRVQPYLQVKHENARQKLSF